MNKNTILKSFFAIAACSALPFANLQAQLQKSVIATNIANESLTHTATSYTLFERTEGNDPQIDREINNVIYLKLNKEKLQELLENKDPLVSISFPVQGGNGKQSFTLNNFNILDDGFKVYQIGADGIKKVMNVDLGIFYRGVLDQSEQSLAAFSFTKNQVVAVFSTLDGGNYNLVLNAHNPGANKDQYILFKESDIKNGRRPACAVSETKDAISADGNTAAKGAFNSCHKVRVSMHGDYELYQKVNNDSTAAAEYLTSLFNVDAALFNNEGINTVLSEIVINTAPDGYTFGGSDEVLVKFGEQVHTSFNGDITQMVTGYTEWDFPPLGGLAWLDVLCQTPQIINQNGQNVWYGPFSMVDNYIIDGVPQVPIYSWDAEASTHEMGHNLGSPHTQSCTWPNGPIDACYQQEGSCAPGPQIPFNTGTIMSYCHLDANVGINFAYGFGPLPGALIRSKVASKACLSSFEPINTLTVANTIRIANRQCTDANWTYFYYDNNTASEADDELLLMLKPNGQNIGDVDVTGMEVKMTTQSYGSNTGRTVTSPYAINDWKELNRTWKVTLPNTVSQPAANVSVRFPFTNQDVLDIKGSHPTATDVTLKVVAFKNLNAANNPSAATASDVNYYTNTTDTANTTKWKKGTTGSYNYAEFVTNTGVFGGSMGFGDITTGIHNVSGNYSLVVYPNPASSVLNIRMPEHVKVSNAAVAIIDNLGRSTNITLSAKDNDATIGVDISSLSAGVYCLRLVSNGQNYNGYFVKH
jgi:hypothetical protein